MTDQNIPEKLQNIAEGKAGFNQYLNLSQEKLQALAVLGSRYYEQGKVDEAITVFKGLIAFDPNFYYGHAGLGAIALREEKLDDAVSHLKRAAELNPNEPTVRANLGEALLRKAQFTDAASEFALALKLDPQSCDAGVNRARAILQGMHVAVTEIQRVGVV